MIDIDNTKNTSQTLNPACDQESGDAEQLLCHTRIELEVKPAYPPTCLPQYNQSGELPGSA